MNVSMYAAVVRDCAYIRSHDMPNVLFLVLIYGDIPIESRYKILNIEHSDRKLRRAPLVYKRVWLTIVLPCLSEASGSQCSSHEFTMPRKCVQARVHNITRLRSELLGYEINT